MPRTAADSNLSTKAARSRLAPRHAPYWHSLGSGAAIGYRKGTGGGTWSVRTPDTRAANGYRQASLGAADDTLKADGVKVLDYREAEAAARGWIARHNRVMAGIEDAPVAPITVREAMSAYVADYKARGGKALVTTEIAIAAHILPTLGEIRVDRLTRAKVSDWLNARALAPRHLRAKKGFTLRPIDPSPDAQRRRRATANRLLTILKAALNLAHRNGHVPTDAAWSTVQPFRSADSSRLAYLTDDESDRLLAACPADFRALAAAALLTGCRYGELAAIRGCHFDRVAGALAIPVSKGGKARMVFLTPQGVELLTDRAAGKGPLDLLFTRRGGGPWGKNHQSRLMADSCAAAGIVPSQTFHILRHTYASRLVTRGVSLAVVGEQLGHADGRMTSRYSHLAPSHVADAVRAAFGSLNVSGS